MSSPTPNSENLLLSENEQAGGPTLLNRPELADEISIDPTPATHDALLACYAQDVSVECLATAPTTEVEMICPTPSADVEGLYQEEAVSSNQPECEQESIPPQPMQVSAAAEQTEVAKQVSTAAQEPAPEQEPVTLRRRVPQRPPVAEQAPAAEKPAAEHKPVAESEPVGEQQPAADDAVEAEADLGFAAFPLRREVLQAIEKSGYDTPTAIQAEIIPYMLDGRDVLAQSQTGTGKTAAFALPILTTIDVKKAHPQVLVLAPTRELAIQVAKSFSTYGASVPGFAVAAIYGGQDYEPQLKQLRRGVQVVVGTPGRVIDHVNRGTLNLGKLDCLVLDEADEMLNMGFLEDVQFVLEKTPATRQVALFSATLPGPIREIADEYLRDPARITIKKKTATAESIRQRALFVSPRDKVDALVRLLEVEETDGVIVFTKTKDATISVAEGLCREGLSAVALNGDMPQKVRERTISQLKNGKLDILVATDVAARGLDVPRISHVFNFDLPHDSESYIHRVGRTGRAGRDGEAIIFLTNAQRSKLRQIERATKQPIEIIGIPTAEDINAMRVKRFGQQITDISAEKDLTHFKELISSYAEETGKPLDMIAAALAELCQQGRPFLMKDRPATARSSHREENFDRGDHFGRGDRQGGSHDRGGKAPRQLGPPREGMVRYRIDVGWQDGVKPGNIVGAVANEAGIEGQYIGPINIRDEFSTIDLPEGMPSDIYQKLRKTWVSGKRLNLEVSRDTGGDGGSRGGYSQGGARGRFQPKHAKSGGAPHNAKRSFAGKSKKAKRKAKP